MIGAAPTLIQILLLLFILTFTTFHSMPMTTVPKTMKITGLVTLLSVASAQGKPSQDVESP
jgi:hypothetical protein